MKELININQLFKVKMKKWQNFTLKACNNYQFDKS